MAEQKPTMHIEVAYADPDLQLLRSVDLPVGASVQEAIEASGILDALSRGFVLTKVGLFGRVVSMTHVLIDGDRVELYRPLKLDPKEARRQRALARR